MNWKKYRVKPGKDLKLSAIDTTGNTNGFDKKNLNLILLKNIEGISKFQNKLFAEDRQSLLIILQGMDSSGKDGTIREIMRGVNPQGVAVYSFKHPTNVELEHDYLWRHFQKLPEHGQIAVFNRSHYENVLISKVHPEFIIAERLPGIFKINDIDGKFWNKRYKQINYFEKNLVDNGTQVLKFFLHLSKKEQAKRFLERIENKEKHWKFSSSDIAERNFWNEYQSAYEQALKNTSTQQTPWFVVPSDDKLFAHMLISSIILEKLKEMDPSFPPKDKKEKELMMKAKEVLKNEIKD